MSSRDIEVLSAKAYFLSTRMVVKRRDIDGLFLAEKALKGSAVSHGTG
jgi:hypothetical protein